MMYFGTDTTNKNHAGSYTFTLNATFEGQNYTNTLIENEFSVYISISCKAVTWTLNYAIEPIVYKMNGEIVIVDAINKDMFTPNLFNDMYEPDVETCGDHQIYV